MNKWVYIFSKEKTDGEAKMRDLLGGKGANLAEMSKLGLPVPPGFTITTEVCNQFYKNDKNFPEELYKQVSNAINQIEELVKNEKLSNLAIETIKPEISDDETLSKLIKIMVMTPKIGERRLDNLSVLDGESYAWTTKEFDKNINCRISNKRKCL